VLLGRWSRAVPLALLGTLGLLALAWRDDFAFQLAFLHLHNVVALALWFFLRPRPLSHAWIPGLTLSGAALILGGALDPVVTAMGGWSAPSSGADFGDLVTTHTQGLEPTLAARAVLSFCFLQSVHYAVWLRLIPDDARERRAPRTFRASWRALVHDFGLPALLFVAALALLIGGWGVVNLAAARDGLPVTEYATRLVKKAIVGVGSADKRQVQAMVERLLPGVRVAGADAADALAVAIAHAHLFATAHLRGAA
jgi:hypothetical protein